MINIESEKEDRARAPIHNRTQPRWCCQLTARVDSELMKNSVKIFDSDKFSFSSKMRAPKVCLDSDGVRVQCGSPCSQCFLTSLCFILHIRIRNVCVSFHLVDFRLHNNLTFRCWPLWFWFGRRWILTLLNLKTKLANRKPKLPKLSANDRLVCWAPHKLKLESYNHAAHHLDFSFSLMQFYCIVSCVAKSSSMI